MKHIIYISTNPIYNRIEEQIQSIMFFCNLNNINFTKIITKDIKNNVLNSLKQNKNIMIIIPRNLIGTLNLKINRFLKLNNNFIVNLNTEQLCNNNNIKNIKNYYKNYNYFIDYSFTNKQIFYENKLHLDVLPHLFYNTKYKNNNIKDINVLFLGRFKGKRKQLFNKLVSLGINPTVIQNNCFGKKKELILKRTKIIIDTEHSTYLNNPNPHRCIPGLYYGCIILTTFQLETNNYFYKFIEKYNLEDIPTRVKQILNNYKNERITLQNKLNDNYQKINLHNLKFYKHFFYNFYKLCVIISSKNPKELLLNNISNIINFYPTAKILIVDSDSTYLDIYKKINDLYPTVEIDYIKNKNFEYGAYKYGFEKYPNYEKYICIQDYFIINTKIDINKVNDICSYTYHKHMGYLKAMGCLKRFSIMLLKNSPILKTFNLLHNKKFNQAQHNSFIISNNTFKKIITNLDLLPYNKKTSISYELIFGLFFIHFNYKTLPINNFVTKIHGNR